ncbi:hypothetical protein [Roseinatronobacter thiooxidans]|uniref:hypothetical protein n=1 Tax=Roseinatronobacter thiooxidans TaxID=121821 RepID=UPI001B884718|nr:hypothetical protein [Roseinatronobacter thiooxidans]
MIPLDIDNGRDDLDPLGTRLEGTISQILVPSNDTSRIGHDRVNLAAQSRM